MSFHAALEWSIRPDKFQPYPELSCSVYGKPMYDTGLVKDKNGNQIRITAKTFWKVPKKYTIYIEPEKNINKIFEQVVKDFNMSDEDKPHLWKLLTDFKFNHVINNEINDDFELFLSKYNFKICYWL